MNFQNELATKSVRNLAAVRGVNNEILIKIGSQDEIEKKYIKMHWHIIGL